MSHAEQRAAAFARCAEYHLSEELEAARRRAAFPSYTGYINMQDSTSLGRAIFERYLKTWGSLEKLEAFLDSAANGVDCGGHYIRGNRLVRLSPALLEKVIESRLREKGLSLNYRGGCRYWMNETEGLEEKLWELADKFVAFQLGDKFYAWRATPDNRAKANTLAELFALEKEVSATMHDIQNSVKPGKNGRIKILKLLEIHKEFGALLDSVA